MIQFLPIGSLGAEGVTQLFTALPHELKQGSATQQFVGNLIGCRQLHQQVRIVKVQPTTPVLAQQHLLADGTDERPVLVAVGAFHVGHHLQAGIEAVRVVLPRQRLPEGGTKDIQQRSGATRPLEVTRPSPLVPAGVERRADVAAIPARGAFHVRFGQQLEQRAERRGVTQEIAILGGLGDAVMHAGQTAGDRAQHPLRAERPHQVLVEFVELEVVHKEKSIPS